MKKYGGVIESVEALTALKGEIVRRKCWLLSAEVAFASGDVSAVEEELLGTMERLLRLPTAETEEILAVLATKYAS